MQVCRGHHILCQTLGYLCLQGIGCYLTVGCIVGAQVFFLIDLTDEDNHLLQALYLQHDILDLAQLDTQATQLNLMVGTSEDHHITIGEPLGIVARTIDTFTMIFDEAFSSHLVEVIVTACHATTTDIQLTHYSNGQFVAILIDDKLLHVELRLSYGHHRGIRLLTASISVTTRPFKLA